MDPSALKCVYINSFSIKDNIPSNLHTYTNIEYNNIVKQKVTSINKSNISTENSDNSSNNLIIPISLSKHIDLFDPFHNVSYYPFMSRDSITLANIDAIFNFSRHKSGYILKQDTKDYTFATLEDGPGNFTQYILYRNPNSYGYGITPIDHSFSEQLDFSHFNITTGDFDTGNLIKEYKSFIQFVRSVEATGLDVVVGNYISDKDIDPIGYLIRLITTLGIISIGGTFVCKISDINDPLMTDLLWITTRCFDRITLFKPISTPSYDKIIYIIAENAKINNIEWLSYLEESYSNSLKRNTKLVGLLEDIPKEFKTWITDFNNFVDMYNKYLLEQSQQGKVKLYDTYKCKAIWNLPVL